jgi:hypothetical protein
MGTISFLNGLIAIMVPSEAPIGIESKIAFTINPIMNAITKESGRAKRVGQGTGTGSKQEEGLWEMQQKGNLDKDRGMLLEK